jgi:hypothetical protein
MNRHSILCEAALGLAAFAPLLLLVLATAIVFAR